MLANIFWILALYELDITTMTPLYNMRTVFAVLFGVLLLAEKLSAFQLVLIALMICGGVLVSLDERMSWRSMLSKGSVLVLAGMLVFTMDAVFIKKAIAQNGFWATTLWSLVIAQIFFCFTLPKFAGEIKKFSKKQGLFVFCVAIFDLIGTLAANRAYKDNVSISSAIISLPLSAVFAFILSLMYPKLLEKHPAKVYLARFAGLVLIVWAAIKLS